VEDSAGELALWRRFDVVSILLHTDDDGADGDMLRLEHRHVA